MGFLRRNLLTPMPCINDLTHFNGELLSRCDQLLEQERYTKATPIKTLFKENQRRGLPLPTVRFRCVRHDSYTASKQRIFTIAGHEYLVGSAWAGRTLTREAGYDTSTFFDQQTAEHILDLPRVWKRQHLPQTAPATLLELACTRARRWRESLIRAHMPDPGRRLHRRPGTQQRRKDLGELHKIRTTHRLRPNHARRRSTHQRRGGTDRQKLSMTYSYGQATYHHDPAINLAAYNIGLMAS